MAYLLGFDLGTSSIKALLMDITGKVLSIASENYSIICPVTGWAEQDPETWWRATTRLIQQALACSKSDAALIKGIRFSGQMHGLVAIDEKGDLIRPAIIWADTRSVSERDRIYAGHATISRLSLCPQANCGMPGSHPYAKAP